jgi:AraC-like DNA-binding protein
MKHFKTISEFHEFINLPKPQHPLISVVDVGTVPHSDINESMNMALDFYSISVKRMGNFKATYGQQPFDFNEGIMSFMSPKQVFSIAVDNKNEAVKKSGWVIYIHPNFIWNTALAKTIKNYDFWDYAFNEALFLSAKEEETMNSIRQNIQRELDANIDNFSKQIITSQIESLLNYANRFYHRQFIIREKTNHQILERLEDLLVNYFNSDNVIEKGLPTVKYIAENLNLSPKYLSNLLRVLTGQNTQQHIHDKLIEKAKEKLSITNLTVSESFSKLFKAKTNISPLEFRASFN